MAGESPGPGIDSRGNAVLDPTRNVLDLVDAAMRRQDDMRRSDQRRQDDLREMESKHHREVSDMRHNYEGELRRAESERLNSIRAVDQGQVQRTADVQTQVASALAAQVVATADAFRVTLTAALEPIQKDIADLRKTQYEQAGQKAQTIEKGTGNRAWVGLVIAGLAALSAGFLGTAGIAITVVLTLMNR